MWAPQTYVAPHVFCAVRSKLMTGSEQEAFEMTEITLEICMLGPLHVPSIYCFFYRESYFMPSHIYRHGHI